MEHCSLTRITGWSCAPLSSKGEIYGTVAEKSPGTEDLLPLMVARNTLWSSTSYCINKRKSKNSKMNEWPVEPLIFPTFLLLCHIASGCLVCPWVVSKHLDFTE